MTESLLIVECIMLHAHCNAVLLDFLYVRNNHLGCEERILSHILEVTTIERSTINVHSRSEKYVLFTEACLFSYNFSVKSRHILIPCSCKSCQCRECDYRVVCPSSLLPLVPKNLCTDSVRTVCRPEFRDTEARNTCRREFRLSMEDLDLLLESHARKCILNALFNWFFQIKIDREIGLCALAGSQGHCRQHA